MKSIIFDFYKKNEALCCVLFIFAISFISVLWFKGDNLFSGTDSYFPLERMESMRTTLFAWDDRSSGSITASLAFIFPYGAILMLSEYLGISLPVTQKIWFYYIFVGSGLSMFFLVATITKYTRKVSHYPTALFASLLFMFNPYVGAMATSYSYLWLTYSFLPLKLGLYIKGLMEKKNFQYIIFFVFVWIATSASQYTNPKYLILDLLPLFLFFIYHLFFIAQNKIERIQAFKFSLIFFLVLTLLCVYWLLPVSLFIGEAFANSKDAYAIINLPRHIAFGLNSATSSMDAMRLLGLWALYSGYEGVAYFGWIDMYKHPVLILLGCLIPVIVFLPILFKTKIKIYYFLFAFNLLAFFGMMGVREPFGKIGTLLTNKVPLYLDTFSYPYQIFGIYFVFSYVALFSFGLYTLSNHWKFKEKTRMLFIGLVGILLIGIYGRPVWSGEIMFPRSFDTFKYLPSYLYNVPGDYYKTSNFLKKNKLDSKIFSLPYSSSGGAIYLWNLGYSGIDITPRFFGNVIYGQNPEALLINKLLSESNVEKVNFFMAHLNTRRVLFHNDTHPNLFDRNSVYDSKTKDILKSTLINYDLNRKLNNIKIFLVNDQFFLPHFYTPKNNIISKQKIKDLPEIVSQDDWEIRSAVFFENQNLGKEKVLDELKSPASPQPSPLAGEGDSPVLEFKKINPTKYQVRVHSASGKFPLVFSESFHDGWRAYVAERTLASPQAEEEAILQNYKILDGNEDDQATREELMDFIQRGYITTLGDLKEKTIEHKKWEDNREKLDYVEKYNIDFISKNFQGTIQNDNLPSGNFWETWFKKSLPEENHLMANGYANSWVIDADEICGNPSFPPLSPSDSSPQAGEQAIKNNCIKNPDGTYDLELVIEFWPQRLFYVGLFVSGTTLLGCVFYLGFDYYKRKKSKRAGLNEKKSLRG